MPIGGYGYGVTSDYTVKSGKRCPACGKTKCKHGRKARVF